LVDSKGNFIEVDQKEKMSVQIGLTTTTLSQQSGEKLNLECHKDNKYYVPTTKAEVDLGPVIQKKDDKVI
jgi:hypothetical protein